MRAIPRTSNRTIIAGAALMLVALVSTAGPATAAEGRGHGADHAAASQGHGQSKNTKGKGHGKGHGKGNHGQHGQGNGNGQGHGNGSGNSHGQANGQGDGHGDGHGDDQANGQGHAGGTGDPSGNNGTVKIETLGDLDAIPNNTPHPGCTFQIEWYGYDEGADVISTVGFAMQAPTSDVALTVAGPSTVFVGGDPATGAGTATGLDGVQAYTLSFAGAAHPKQGYHVKLTVATPYSRGNDTKTKVFWVEPCATAPVEEVPGEEVPGEEVPGEEVPGDTGVSPSEETLEGGADQGVLGTSADTSENQAGGFQGTTAEAAAVPTRIDAGEEGALRNLASSPLALILAGLGILVAMAGTVARRRPGAARTS